MTLSNSAAIRRYVFWVSYDGSKFPEMAKGGTGFGVMDLLYQTVANSIFGSRSQWDMNSGRILKFSPSSRTDAKVHAVKNAIICQVPIKNADFDKTPELKQEYLMKWNNTIENVNPNSMEIKDVHNVSAGFCIRRNVAYRHYTYRLAVAKSWDIWESLKLDPSVVCFSERDYSWRLPPGFSPQKCLEAGKLFEGEQVMGSFFKHSEREKRNEPFSPTALKYIMNVGLYRGEAYSLPNDLYDYYNVSIIAKSFVREQIRRMMSCLVSHSYDRLSLKTIKWLLKNPISSNFYDRKIPIAPPNGLFLTNVIYDPLMFKNPIPYHFHSWDY